MPLRSTAAPSPIARLLLGVSLLVAWVVASATPGAAQAPPVTIEKSTNGVDADAAPGPIIETGQTVTWTWTVTSNTADLYDLVVSDSSGVTPSCDVTGDGAPDGTHIHPGPLAAGSSFVCTASGTVGDAADGTFEAVGRVVGYAFDGTPHEATDLSHHTPLAPFTADPQVSIRALVNGVDAGADTGPLVAEGSEVVWNYLVTNIGNVPLSDLVVGGAPTIDCGDGTATVAGPLAPGASVTCTFSGAAVAQSAGAQTSSGSVVAVALDPATGSTIGSIEASDPVTYVPVQTPDQLAFTGPAGTALMLAAALTALGLGLVVLASPTRRESMTRMAMVPVRSATRRRR